MFFRSVSVFSCPEFPSFLLCSSAANIEGAGGATLLDRPARARAPLPTHSTPQEGIRERERESRRKNKEVEKALPFAFGSLTRFRPLDRSRGFLAPLSSLRARLFGPDRSLRGSVRSRYRLRARKRARSDPKAERLARLPFELERRKKARQEREKKKTSKERRRFFLPPTLLP